jgi:hypothetical protein
MQSTLAAGWTSAPMSWSADAEWLCYTVSPGFVERGREPNWLFDAARDRFAPRETVHPRRPGVAAIQPSHQIWATRRDAGASVLIEASVWPLTAPCWSPLGRSIAFGRFVPHSLEPNQLVPRGRLEVVIQEALDRKRVILSIPDFELDAEARADFSSVSASWAPDGQYVAFSKPGQQRAILVIKTDSAKLIQVLDGASCPAWSPDGSRLAFLATKGEGVGLQVVERRGHTFLPARPLTPIGRVTAAPSWSGDSRSILAVLERAGARSHEVDLARVSSDTGEVSPLLSLAPENARRGAAIRSVAIDCDRDEERCVFAVDFVGRESEIVWSNPRERYSKRFHPLDPSLRIGSLAVSPDWQVVAARFGPAGMLSHPAIYDPSSSRTSLVIPDDAARSSWLALLASATRSLLIAGLPQAVLDGQLAERPTILPLPGEIQADDPLQLRIRRLVRFGSALCELPDPRREAALAQEDGGFSVTREDHLFFNYLQGNFASAGAALETLEPAVTSRDDRLALLSLRAQIRWSEGDLIGARAIANYLLATYGAPTRRVEETPIGLSISTDPDPHRAWAQYLANRMSAAAPTSTPTPLAPSGGLMNQNVLNPFVDPDFPAIQPADRARVVPFATVPHGRDPRANPGRVPRPVRPNDVPPPRPQPIQRPRPRP